MTRFLTTPRQTLAELIERERIRSKIEAAVARLIDALDAIDHDPDLEDTHDAEAVNEDGGHINDEPHDDEDADLERDWRDVA